MGALTRIVDRCWVAVKSLVVAVRRGRSSAPVPAIRPPQGRNDRAAGRLLVLLGQASLGRCRFLPIPSDKAFRVRGRNPGAALARPACRYTGRHSDLESDGWRHGFRIPRQPFGNASLTHTDRKSTRLNSSHLGISYAVFCLKKKIEIDTIGGGSEDEGAIPERLDFRGLLAARPKDPSMAEARRHYGESRVGDEHDEVV